MLVTLVVVGDDADDYLTPGEHFTLVRGYVARGTVTRRALRLSPGPEASAGRGTA